MAASIAVLATGGARCGGVLAQRPGTCRIVVGFPPGGSTDVVARLLAERMSGAYASAVIVDNRPGAGGRIALEHVRGAPADGTVMALTPHPMMTVYPHLYRKLAYDPLADFVPVTSICDTVAALSVGPAVPDAVRTVAQFVDWCRANPGLAAYGSAGEGTTPHLMGQMFGRTAGLAYLHVPYLGGAPLVQALLGGQIASGFNTLAEVLPAHDAGRLRILATTGTRRPARLSGVPTLKELGYQGVDTPPEWFGVFAPVRTPSDVVERLNASVRAAIDAPRLAGAFGELALEVTGEPAAQFARRFEADHAQWGRIVRAAGLRIEE